MTLPVVNGSVAKGATAANATSLVLTLTAGVAVGDWAYAVIVYGNTPSGIVDSKGNVWQTVSSAGNLALWAAPVRVALVASDTITISFASGTCAAVVASVSNLGQQGTLVGTNGSGSGTSTSPSLNSVAHVAAVGDALYILAVQATTVTTFDSVDSSYTILDQVATTGTGTQRAVPFIYKVVASANPMPSQTPTVTLGASKTWTTRLIEMPGRTDRGQVGRTPFDGAPQPVHPLIRHGRRPNPQADPLFHS